MIVPPAVPAPLVSSIVPYTWVPDIVRWIVTVGDPEMLIVPSTLVPVSCRLAWAETGSP